MSNRYNEFLAEGEDLLESLQENLSKLEFCFTQSTVPTPDLVNGIFRDMHSLKGISSVLGLNNITSVSHGLEGLLDRLRMGMMPLSASFVEILFEGVEILRRLVAKIRDCSLENSNPDIWDDAIPSLIRTIEQNFGKEGDPKGRLIATVRGIDPSIQNVLTEYENYRLQENFQKGWGIYRMKTALPLESFDRDLLALRDRFAATGEVIATIPASGVSSDGRIDFVLLVAGPETLSQIKGIEVEEISSADPSSFPRDSAPVGEELDHQGPPSFSVLSGDGDTTGHIDAHDNLDAVSVASVRRVSQTVRVEISKLDHLLNVLGEIVLIQGHLAEVAREFKAHVGFQRLASDAQKATVELSRQLTFLREGLIDIRMVPITHIFDRLVRVIRKLSRETGKEVHVRVLGGETRMDKAMMEEIVDPLMHLVTNAVDHGIERMDKRETDGKPRVGTITLSAVQRGNNVVIGVEDDGEGVDLQKIYQRGVETGRLHPGSVPEEKDLLKLIFQPGFSTRQTADTISGRGVGLDVVAKNVTHLRGLIDVTTHKGEGTKFFVSLPLTLLIIKALIVQVEGRVYAIPINAIDETMLIAPSEIGTIEGQDVLNLRGYTLPLIRLKTLFHLTASAPQTQELFEPMDEVSKDEQENIYVVVAGVAEKRLGIIVDRVLDQQEIVIKALGEGLGHVSGIAGATELGTRKIVLVLDVGELVEEVTSEKGNPYAERFDH